MIDVLHVLDQGVSSHTLGNVFWELKAKFGGATQELQVANLYADMKAWHKANKRPMELQGKLTVARLRTGKDWPKLKAKGASTRHLVDYAFDLASRHNSGSVHDRQRLAVVQILKSFYDTCHAEGRYLSAAAKAKIAPMGRRFVGIYGNLSNEALNREERGWKNGTQVSHV